MPNLKERAIVCTEPEILGEKSAMLEPLGDMYRELTLTPPVGRILGPLEIPLECRRVLVHKIGMTRTLERAYRQKVGLKVLRSVSAGGIVTRQIVLFLEKCGLAVEMALIRIYLEQLPEAARHLVLERTIPLGTILNQQGVAVEYDPYIYFSIVPDAVLGEYARTGNAHLYGRRVKISGVNGKLVAEAIEISISVV